MRLGGLTFASGSVGGHLSRDGDGAGVEVEVKLAAAVVDVDVGPHLEEGHRVPHDEDEERDCGWQMVVFFPVE